jgi:all-trans-8'-apo-beta-carotenal 15,15'-oxygenase
VSENDVKRDIWDAGSRCIVNEPLFVPRPGAAAEDEGWVLVTVHDAEADKGKLVILDAQCLAQGPVATIHLQHFLPAGLHGSFAADVFTQDCLNDAFSAAPEWCEPNVVRAL